MGELLNIVHIASPCSADWEKMVGNERVRHCSQCNLNVYNLSAMSGLEARDLVAKHEGRMCVHFYHRKDGTILTRNCPVGLKIVMRRVSRVAGIALSAAMSAVPLAAQSATQPQAQTVQADSGLEIKVVDIHASALPGVNVDVTDSSGKTVARLVTANDGIARLTNLSPGAHTLTISSAEFQTVKTTVWIRDHVTFKLEISKDPPLIETTNAQVGVTGGAVVYEPPLIENRAGALPATFDDSVLVTGGLIITENPPIEVAPATHHGFFRRVFSKLRHLWR